jgi:hypothetical protein
MNFLEDPIILFEFLGLIAIADSLLDCEGSEKVARLFPVGNNPDWTLHRLNLLKAVKISASNLSKMRVITTSSWFLQLISELLDIQELRASVGLTAELTEHGETKQPINSYSAYVRLYKSACKIAWRKAGPCEMDLIMMQYIK